MAVNIKNHAHAALHQRIMTVANVNKTQKQTTAIRSLKQNTFGIVLRFYLGKCQKNLSEYPKGQFRNLNFQKDYEGTNTHLTFSNVVKRLDCP